MRDSTSLMLKLRFRLGIIIPPHKYGYINYYDKITLKGTVKLNTCTCIHDYNYTEDVYKLRYNVYCSNMQSVTCHFFNFHMVTSRKN